MDAQRVKRTKNAIADCVTRSPERIAFFTSLTLILCQSRVNIALLKDSPERPSQTKREKEQLKGDQVTISSETEVFCETKRQNDHFTRNEMKE